MKSIKYLLRIQNGNDSFIEEIVDSILLLEGPSGYGSLIYVPPKSGSEIARCGCFIFATESQAGHWERADWSVAFLNISSVAAIDDLAQAVSELEYKYEEDSV